MSETAASETTGQSTESGESKQAAVEEFKPITSQDDLNKVIGERVARERAKFADYEDVKSKASRLDEIEQANKSEIEKATEKAAIAERERDAARSEALRLRIAAKHNISDDDADLFLTGTDEATLTKQAERLAQRTGESQSSGNVVRSEGRSTTQPKPDDRKAFADFLTGHTS